MAQLVVFMFQVLYHYATNPNTPFDVDEMTFLDSRNKTEDELEVMLAHLQKQFIVEFPGWKGISCFFSGIQVVPLIHAGFAMPMLSFDQGNLTQIG